MYVSVLVAMIGAMMFGLDQGNFGNVQQLARFRLAWCLGKYGNETQCGNPHNNTLDQHVFSLHWDDHFILWGATLIVVGAAVGALTLGPWLARKYGRKACIGIGGGVCFLGCLMASYLSFHKVFVFFVGRTLTGFGVGLSTFALPLYNAEVSTPKVRGFTGSFFQFNVVLGSFIACLVTLIDKDWKLGIMLPGIAGAVLSFMIYFVPESPRFKMYAEGYDAGVTELKKLREGDCTDEAQDIRAQIRQEIDSEKIGWQDLCRDSSFRKRVAISCCLVGAQQATGVNAFLGYAGTVFGNIGITNPIWFNTIFNSMMILGCLLGLYLIDSEHGGRRCQLLCTSVIMGPPLVLAGFAFKFELPGWVMASCVIIYGVGFQLAWGIVPWIYPSEIFSMSEREKAVSLAVFVNYVNNMVVIYITPYLMLWSISGTLWFFGALNIINCLFVYFFIVETKGIPLELIPHIFLPDRDMSECSTPEASFLDVLQDSFASPSKS